MSISQWLREMLREYESSYDMALALGVREPTLNRWLNGKRIPSVSSCIKLAEATHIPIEEVVRMAGLTALERQDAREPSEAEAL